MKQLLYLLKAVWKRLRPRLKSSVLHLLKQIGLELLSKDQTRDYLKPYQLAVFPENPITLPPVRDALDSTKILFNAAHIHIGPGYVWRVEKPDKKAILLRCGSLLLDRKLLLTDFTFDAFKKPLTPAKRIPYRTETLIAPWSQFFDEALPPKYNPARWVVFRGYYDFMMLLATKVCRIKDALPENVFAKSIVAYPLLNTAYEKEMLALLGLKEEQIVDSRYYNIAFDTCLLGDADIDNWCYPNARDIMSLKRHIEVKIPVKYKNEPRIYIRRAGRRRILNEDALIPLLKRYDFTIIEDIPRSIAEQVSIYKNATFILGPHGASFTNIIWCKPGTHLFELFNVEYVPNYFLYLAEILGLRYSAYCKGTSVRNTRDALSADISISFSELEESLQQLLGSEQLS